MTLGNVAAAARPASLLALLACAAPALVHLAAGPLSTGELAWTCSAALLLLGAAFALRTRAIASAMASERQRVLNLEERVSRFEGLRPELNARSDEQQAVLGDLARGLDEIRRLLDGERANLGAVADGLTELQRAAQYDRKGLHDARRDLDGLMSLVDEERGNLGKVAGGLDELRRSTAGVGLTTDRYAALTDALLDVAARVDAIDSALRGGTAVQRAGSATEPSAPGAS